jgi:hypothetical protein
VWLVALDQLDRLAALLLAAMGKVGGGREAAYAALTARVGAPRPRAVIQRVVGIVSGPRSLEEVPRPRISGRPPRWWSPGVLEGVVVEDTEVPADVAALLERIEVLERDRHELRAWIAGPEARIAVTGETLLLSTCRARWGVGRIVVGSVRVVVAWAC